MLSRCFSGLIALILSASISHAAVTLSASGVSSANVPVSFDATLSISGNTLSITLSNSSPVTSLNPNDLLSSFYFDIVDNANNRPTLTYVSAVGDVYLSDKNNPDVLQTANANLMAVNPGDYTWQFKPMDPTYSPFVGFGIGTVGNNNLTPNNFSGNIVDGLDFSIIRGDCTTQNLDGKLLVRDTATFVFTGVLGFTEANISHTFSFGMGTAPDSLLVPEPSAMAVAGLGLLGLVALKRLRKA